MLTMNVSERRTCRALGQHRSTQRKVPRGREDEAALTADLVALAERYGRYGYRKICALLKAAGDHGREAAQAEVEARDSGFPHRGLPLRDGGDIYTRRWLRAPNRTV